APESQRLDRGEVAGLSNFARCVALDGEPGIVRIHALPIVLDANPLLAAKLGVNGQPTRPGIDGILDQFLDNRSGPPNDLASGNLIGKLGRKLGDLSQSVSHFHRQRRLRRSQTRDRNSVRRRAHVVQADLVEEMDRRWIASMLAADAELEIRSPLSSTFDPNSDESPHTLGIK